LRDSVPSKDFENRLNESQVLMQRSTDRDACAQTNNPTHMLITTWMLLSKIGQEVRCEGVRVFGEEKALVYECLRESEFRKRELEFAFSHS
jgi:hypothetical protein